MPRGRKPKQEEPVQTIKPNHLLREVMEHAHGKKLTDNEIIELIK